MKQDVERGTTNPAPPCCGITRFLGIDQKRSHVIPWSLHSPHLPWKFHANWSSRFLVILLTKKQTKKEINRKQYTVPDTFGAGN